MIIIYYHLVIFSLSARVFWRLCRFGVFFGGAHFDVFRLEQFLKTRDLPANLAIQIKSIDLIN